MNGVAVAFDVPIYNPIYYKCADIDATNMYQYMEELGQLVSVLACRSDVERIKETRLWTRIEHFPDMKVALFMITIPDITYLQLFMECFTNDKQKQLHLDINQYAEKCLLEARMRYDHDTRKKRPFVVYEKNYGIHKTFTPRLLLLLRICKRYLVKGVINIDNEYPPWIPNNNEYSTKPTSGKQEVIDLTMDVNEED